tara:strand:+ start:197 stop:466 length:270 start_codon:yes stop_codon:yes gene_type:complete
MTIENSVLIQPNIGSPIINIKSKLVGLDGVEPSTSRLSGVRSNQAELQAPAISNSGSIFLLYCKNPKSKIHLSLSSPIDFKEQFLISQN